MLLTLCILPTTQHPVKFDGRPFNKKGRRHCSAVDTYDNNYCSYLVEYGVEFVYIIPPGAARRHSSAVAVDRSGVVVGSDVCAVLLNIPDRDLVARRRNTVRPVMDPMQLLANKLMKYKSFKERRSYLNNSLDLFSFNHPDLYFLLFKEMKRRELESNDPYKITQWSYQNLASNVYVKLHGALILVKGHNTIAKEMYLVVLDHVLCQTIENLTNVEESIKICYLIEKSKPLSIIYERLKLHIKQIKQLQGNTISTCNGTVMKIKKNFKNDNFKPSLVEPFEYNTKSSPKIHQSKYSNTSVLQTVKQPSHFESTNNRFSSFNQYSSITHPNLVVNGCSPFEFPFILTIVQQDMVEAFSNWLNYLKLHKYQWFFNSLSYLEIEFIDEDNIEGFINKVNRNSITKGAQKKICLSTKILRNRKQKFQDILKALDLEVTPNELNETMTYMKDVLHYPLPNKNCVVDDQLQLNIVLIMEKSFGQLIEKFDAARYSVANTLLGASINNFFECIYLITGNKMFMKHQTDKLLFLCDLLKYTIYQNPKKF
ncbi:Hypothetical protein CINCED_3A025581 [Cinara cedri]|uniref:Uncharacterized protein n=1 Tax=Cinara cedri TaxID=506608 RepID=A0A5E4M1V6_9HEMI|nr:Hypothetical protein CINCED_3A025581 [Cinara cedri]